MSVKWKLVLLLLNILLILMLDRCTVCIECTIGSEIILKHSLVPLGDEAQVKAHFDPFRHNANLDASGCTVCIKCTIGSKSFWTHPMELLGDMGHVESHMFFFGDRVSVNVRLVHGLCQTYHHLRNHFGCT
jgi:hypothetical protein